MTIKQNEIARIKESLMQDLKKENAFWSYSKESAINITDNQLIALTMRYLDLAEIALLFQIYGYRRIKKVWKELLVPEGEYLYTLNRFFAWYYFKAKRPDAYLKSLETRRLNKLFS